MGGGPGKSQREGQGGEQKVPLWSRPGEEARITQCPEAMLVTREPFSALLGKQLGAEGDRERFNPMGAGCRGPRPLWEAGGSQGTLRGPFGP